MRNYCQMKKHKKVISHFVFERCSCRCVDWIQTIITWQNLIKLVHKITTKNMTKQNAALINSSFILHKINPNKRAIDNQVHVSHPHIIDSFCIWRTCAYDGDIAVKHMILATVDARVYQYQSIVLICHVSIGGADTVKELTTITQYK